MDELIFERSSNYSRYEELLMRRDALKKDAFLWDREYIRVFGDRIVRNFELKIECIRKKKTITFCQAAINHGGRVNMEALQQFLEEAMADYQAKLKAMIEEQKIASEGTLIPEVQMIKIKKLYKNLAKRLHPDINPLTVKNGELRDLWERVVVAYKCNQLKDLEELEILINATLAALGGEQTMVDIPDIEDKIAEVLADIEAIKNTDPYLYRFLLEDSTAVKEEKRELDEEFSAYEEYRIELEELLQSILASGGVTLYG